LDQHLTSGGGGNVLGFNAQVPGGVDDDWWAVLQHSGISRWCFPIDYCLN